MVHEIKLRKSGLWGFSPGKIQIGFNFKGEDGASGWMEMQFKTKEHVAGFLKCLGITTDVHMDLGQESLMAVSKEAQKKVRKAELLFK